MFCETILFYSLVCIPLSQCLPKNSLILMASGSGWGVVLKSQLEVFLFSTPTPPPPPHPPPNLSLTAGVSRVFIFLYDEKRKQQQQQSTKNTRHDKTNKGQNLFNLLNDGFKSILLVCRDSLASSL